MKLLVAASACAIAFASLPLASAGAHEASDADCRLETLPARTERIERVVEVPAITKTRLDPIYDTVDVPVYECVDEPRWREVRVPVYATREVPVYKTERVPVHGTKTVTTYRKVQKPVTVELWNPFSCEDEVIELWDECEEVPAGTKEVPAIVGYREQRVQCGTRTERYVTGHRTERVQDGTVQRSVKTGMRTEKRLTGYRPVQVVVEPASTRTVVDVVEHPCRVVTVIPDGMVRTAPLPGSTEILTRSAFEAERETD